MHSGGCVGTTTRRLGTAMAAAAACLLASACALVPVELNLSPLYYHRLDPDGTVQEMDVLWPIVHFERTPEGGKDFRIRPLYRRVTEPELQATEHQFLWPVGRVRSDQEETNHRFFPLWSWRSRLNDEGERDIDWYALFPLLWGGASEDGREDYFAFLPFYADIPQFLSYERFRTFLFPLYVRLDKDGHRHTLWLWPLIGTSSCAEANHEWHRFLPFYAVDVEPGNHERYHVLWPFISWGTENEFTDDPVRTLWFWPLFGTRSSRDTNGLMIAWPLFEVTEKRDAFHRLNVAWPFIHVYESMMEADRRLKQWWFFPFFSRATDDQQDTWTALWPVVWWRWYDNPDHETRQQFVLPFFWHTEQVNKLDDGGEDHTRLWPFVHWESTRGADGIADRGSWSVLSLWPWRGGNAPGVEEAYGWLWQIVHGRQRARDDHAVDAAARLYTSRTRGDRTQRSVPFLFNWESDREGAKLRLFQFLPIPFTGSAGDESKDEDGK